MTSDSSTFSPTDTARSSSTTIPSGDRWDVIIIGGGAAGLSAALILARARRRVLVLDGGQPRNRFAPHMHGVLSRDGYSPLDLVNDGYREVRSANGVIRTARVVETRSSDGGFDVVTESGAVESAHRLIVATGARDVLPSIPGLSEQWGRGVVACPYCDGYEAKGRAVGVLLGSAAGVHKAHMILPYSPDVTVFTALSGPLPVDDRRLLEHRGVRLEDRAVSRVVVDADRLTGLALDDGTVVPLDVVFAEPAFAPLDDPLRQLGADRVDTPMGQCVEVDAFGRTSVAGVWAVGNAVNPGALVPIAMGAGATAALTVNGEIIAEEVATASAALAEVRRG
ncbi:NAD(P)/FAD-dependent oxidoreductase [Microbacterium sp. NPDC087589]|uniref:NAD(P)/FAD-dependent oxidoreductase n=1 Tax=Microbacterium sp. NPDC087589 TaxID=3364191 RepID=UPI0038124562